MGRKVLYILTESSHDALVRPGSKTEETSLVLVQDAVSNKDLAHPHVYALAEDVAERHVTPSVPTISYQDLLRLIFEADHVAVL